jgi:hypothetical protein
MRASRSAGGLQRFIRGFRSGRGGLHEVPVRDMPSASTLIGLERTDSSLSMSLAPIGIVMLAEDVFLSMIQGKRLSAVLENGGKKCSKNQRIFKSS